MKLLRRERCDNSETTSIIDPSLIPNPEWKSVHTDDANVQVSKCVVYRKMFTRILMHTVQPTLAPQSTVLHGYIGYIILYIV